MANKPIAAPTFGQINSKDLPTFSNAVKGLLFTLSNFMQTVAYILSKTVTTDGAGTMDAPLVLENVATASEPAASSANKGGLIYDTTLNTLAYSDGTRWHSVATAQYMVGTSIGTIAAGATFFLGCNAQQATESDTDFTACQSGTISGVRIVTDAAPGVGKNFTYTLRVVHVDTALTGVINGAGTSVNLTGGPITIAVGDRINIKVVTDAASAAARHRYRITLDF